jgi:hypothetical protein
MTLGEQQRIFTKNIMLLIQFAYNSGYELSFGDAFRDARVHGEYGVKRGYSAANSFHKLRLAVDLNLFKDGVYQVHTRYHKPLGDFWESLHELNRWGGRFNDGNHYEMVRAEKKCK